MLQINTPNRKLTRWAFAGGIIAIFALIIPANTALAVNWQFLDGAQGASMTFRWLDSETLQQYRVCDSSDLSDGCSPGQIRYGEVYRLTMTGAGGERIFRIDAAGSQQTGDNAACDAFNVITIQPGGSPKSAHFSNNGVTTDGTSTCPNTQHIVYSENDVAIYDDYDTGYSLSPKGFGLAVNTTHLAKDNEVANTIIAANVASAQEDAAAEEEAGTDCGDAAGVLGWVICAVGDLGDKLTNTFDSVIYSLLDIPVESWTESGAKAAWESFRTISSALIVLVALAGVASQVFSFDFISAYTIRKILPKLFIAVVLIQLSWFLGTMMIEISNTIGYSVQAIILTPFANIAKEQLGNPDLGTINFTDAMQLYIQASNNEDLATVGVTSVMGVAVAISVGSAMAAGGAAVMLMFAGILISAGIAMLVAFTIIALRYVLILGLLIILPLALVAWVLPNTKRWFDQWWNIWFTLLAMFPIIIAVLSLGKAAAIIIALSAGGS